MCVDSRRKAKIKNQSELKETTNNNGSINDNDNEMDTDD